MSLTAIGLVLLSAAIHATWNFLTKSSRDPQAFTAVKCTYYLLALAVAAPFFSIGDFPPAVWWLLLATGVVHAAYAFALATAYRAGDISLVYPIARSAPAVIPVFAVWLLGERLSPGGLAGIAVAVVAVWVVNTAGRFRWAALSAPGAGFAYVTLGTVVAYSLIDKRAMTLLDGVAWSGRAPRALGYMVVSEALASALYLAVMAPRLSRTNLRAAFREEKRRGAFATALEIVSYGLILYVYRSEQVSYVVAVRQTSVIVAVLLGTLVLREPFGRSRLVGAGGLVLAVFLIARYA